MMRPEDRILAACTRQAFTAVQREEVLRLAADPAVHWDRIAETAQSHGVAPLVRLNLRRCGAALALPAGAERRLTLCHCHNLLRKREEAARLAAALAWFHARSIDVMLLKSAALDLLVYERPWYTMAADVDLVLRCRWGSRGFEETRAGVVALYKSGVECDYFEHHDITLNGTLPVDFEKVWRDARSLQVGGLEAFVMSPEDLLLSLCLNSCRKRFFRLRSLCDLAESARRLPGLDWGALARRAREFDCAGIVFAALLVAQETLGCEIPAGALEEMGVRPARQRLLRELVRRLLRSGSFSSLFRPAAKGRFGASLLLPYAALRGGQAWRSLSVAWKLGRA